MNSNGSEIEFRQRGDEVDMWVERDCAPFDDYVCGVLRKDDEGFFRFHPNNYVVMHCKLLREAAEEVARLNDMPNAELSGPPKYQETCKATAAEVSALRLDAERWRGLSAWAVARWRDEVGSRPLVNKNRRSLDDAWRQVIRLAGGDPDALVGPSHDALLAANGIGAA